MSADEGRSGPRRTGAGASRQVADDHIP